MAERTYCAIYEHDPADDAWLVRIDGFDGCQTYGRTKQEAAQRIEEALGLWFDHEPGEFVLEHR